MDMILDHSPRVIRCPKEGMSAGCYGEGVDIGQDHMATVPNDSGELGNWRSNVFEVRKGKGAHRDIGGGVSDGQIKQAS